MCKAETGHMSSKVAARTISTTEFSRFVLLCLSQKMTYWLFSENVILEQASLILTKVLKQASAAVYVNSSIQKKPAHAILKAVSMFTSSTEIGSADVIF